MVVTQTTVDCDLPNLLPLSSTNNLLSLSYSAVTLLGCQDTTLSDVNYFK